MAITLIALTATGACTRAEAIVPHENLIQNSDRVSDNALYFPGSEKWKRISLSKAGFNEKLIGEMTEILSDEYQINSVLVLKNGYIAYEHNKPGYTIDSTFNIYSCTKTVTGAVVGIAIDKGFIESAEEPVLDYFPAIKNDSKSDKRKAGIRISHLLKMNSGLDWPEWTSWNYFFAPMVQSGNWVKFVIERDMAEEPGGHFNYSSGGSHLLSYIVQQSVKKNTAEFAKENLFSKIGMSDVEWPGDPQGVSIGGAWIQMSLADAARFGLLYLNRGKWKDEQIISEQWVDASTSRQSEGFRFPDGRGGSYGYSWWLDTYNGHRVFFAMGAREQYIFVVPDLALVAVFSSNYTKSNSIKPNVYMRDYIMKGAE